MNLGSTPHPVNVAVSLTSTKLRIATRSSPLALWQAEHVAERLRSVTTGLEVELVTSQTFGDRRQDLSIPELGGKGVFCKEIQEQVLAGHADIAVHSAKDLQATTPDGLTIAAFCARSDARDALVGSTLADLPDGATVATGSNRRSALLRDRRPDLRVIGLRGNVDTRLAKLDAAVDPTTGVTLRAIVLAATALDRLGVAPAVVERLPADEFVPQVGQGALAVEARSDDRAVVELVRAIDDEPTALTVRAERSFLAELGGDCDLPAGANAEVLAAGTVDGAADLPAGEGGPVLRIRGVLAAPDGTLLQRAVETGPPSHDPGRSLARTLRKMLEAAAPPDV
ncbi:MAG: hydroxymethylbilane synthase [Actinomycetota bacterium]